MSTTAKRADQLAGQVDLFELIDEELPQPEFTVYEMTPALGWPHLCGWGCGKNGNQGGGATRWPGDDEIGIAYNYCRRCDERHGQPRVGYRERPTPLRLVRYFDYSKGAA